MRSPVPSRRQFLKAVGLGLAGLRAGGLLGGPRRAAIALRGPAGGFFTPQERRTAAALFDTLVPPIGGRGGALRCRAVDYADALLAGDPAEAPPIFHRGPFSGRLPYSEGCAPGTVYPEDGFAVYRPLHSAEGAAWLLRLEGG